MQRKIHVEFSNKIGSDMETLVGKIIIEIFAVTSVFSCDKIIKNFKEV